MRYRPIAKRRAVEITEITVNFVLRENGRARTLVIIGKVNAPRPDRSPTVASPTFAVSHPPKFAPGGSMFQGVSICAVAGRLRPRCRRLRAKRLSPNTLPGRRTGTEEAAAPELRLAFVDDRI